jgi:hypothetical protein
MPHFAKRLLHSLSWRSRVALRSTREFYLGARGTRRSRRIDELQLDPRIVYPCYKSLDAFVDLPRLKSLDGYLRERIVSFLKGQDGVSFHTGPFKQKLFSRTRPGARVIPLTSRAGDSNAYFDLDKPALWQPSKHALEFAELMDFIRTLPFKATGRMIIICDDRGRVVTAHRDHPDPNVCHEFIWFRTTLAKPFYVENSKTSTRLFLESYSAWFDTVNQFHGATSSPNELTFSLRVDGSFTDEFRRHIPVPAHNRASTPALWASLRE